jgi:hypothetical protein
MPQAPAPARSANIPRGAIVTPAYVEREVKAYAVFETEMHTLSFLNTLATTFFSIGSSLASIAIGIWANGKFTEKLSPQADILANFAAPGLCVLAAIFVGLGIWAICRKQTVLDAIRSESKS